MYITGQVIGVVAPQILVSHPVGSGDKDCACPEDGLTPIRSIPSSADIWITSPGLHRSVLSTQHEVLFNPFGGGQVAVLNRPATALLDAYKTPRAWLDDPHGISMQLCELGALQPADAKLAMTKSQPSTLTAWLHITNACNLRCAYCYVRKDDEAMTDETGALAVNAVFRAAQMHAFKTVKLKYAGGEASLNFGLIRSLHAQARLRSRQTGLAFREVVLSNGVGMNRDQLTFLRDEHIRLMISLDGLGAINDAQRAFINGGGSFVQVSRAIDRAVGLGLLPELSITVTPLNAGHLAGVVDFALARGLRFNLNFVRDCHSGATRQSILADQQAIIAGMKEAFVAIEARLPDYRLIDGLVDRSGFDQPHEHACGAGHSYMVIDHHGGVAQCQMEIERTITSVHAADPLHDLRSRDKHFQNVPVSEKEGCRACEWQHWCAGGCPLATHRATGRTDVKSPNCDIYRSLYPDVIRLEGLRLIKWQTA